MHSMGKTIIELHTMLKLTEKGLPKKALVLIVLAIQIRKIQKRRNKPKATKGKASSLTFPRTTSPPPPAKKLVEIQEEDAQPFDNTNECQIQVEHEYFIPHDDETPIRSFARIPQASKQYGFYVVAQPAFVVKTNNNTNNFTRRLNTNNNNSSNVGPNPNLLCKICDLIGHTIESELWHRRLDHPADQVLSILGKSIGPCKVGSDGCDVIAEDEVATIATQKRDNSTSEDRVKCPKTRKSSAESKSRCLSSTTYELIWVMKNLKDLEVDGLLHANLSCDSSIAIQIAANHVFHEKTKHFKIALHLVREKVSSRVINTLKVASANNVTDVFTKRLSITQHKAFCDKLGLVDMFRPGV
nr:ribonuclease H-like domain-containing protein [Tanacetum cinerariifolium]